MLMVLLVMVFSRVRIRISNWYIVSSDTYYRIKGVDIVSRSRNIVYKISFMYWYPKYQESYHRHHVIYTYIFDEIKSRQSLLEELLGLETDSESREKIEEMKTSHKIIVRTRFHVQNENLSQNCPDESILFFLVQRIVVCLLVRVYKLLTYWNILIITGHQIMEEFNFWRWSNSREFFFGRDYFEKFTRGIWLCPRFSIMSDRGILLCLFFVHEALDEVRERSLVCAIFTVRHVIW